MSLDKKGRPALSAAYHEHIRAAQSE